MGGIYSTAFAERMARMPLIRGHHSFEDHFTQIPNDWLRDTRLSFKARGVLALIMSHRQGWSLTINTLAEQNKDGRDSIRSAVQELEEFGYLQRIQSNEGGRFGETTWITKDPTVTDLPMTGFPTTENPNTKNTILKEKQVKKTIKKRHTLPEDWKPSQRLLDMFKDKWPDIDPDYHIEQFTLYYLSADTKHTNWDLAFQRWMNKEQAETSVNPRRAGAANSTTAQRKKDAEKEFSRQYIEQIQEMEANAAPPPKCEHGKNIALCVTCSKRLDS